MLSLPEVSEFKKYLLETTGTYLHFHDTCSGMRFSISESCPQTIERIDEYLTAKKLKAVYSKDMTSFTITS